MLNFTHATRQLFLLIGVRIVLCAQYVGTQVVFAPSRGTEHITERAIFAALKEHADPVAALVSLQPDFAAELAQPRLLHIFGEQKPEWMTEGDKLRLRRRGRKFIDITDHQYVSEQLMDASWAGNARESDRANRSLVMYLRRCRPSQFDTPAPHKATLSSCFDSADARCPPTHDELLQSILRRYYWRTKRRVASRSHCQGK
jgi:hypothetical protein